MAEDPDWLAADPLLASWAPVIRERHAQFERALGAICATAGSLRV